MKFPSFILVAELLFCLNPAFAKVQWETQSDSLFQASRYQAALEMLCATRPQSVDEQILWHLEQGRHRIYLADYDEAMCHLQDAEKMVLILRDESHPLLPAIYDRLGEWYRWRYFDSQKSICLSNRALLLQDQYHPRDSLGLAQTYYQLGRAYQELNLKRNTGEEHDFQNIAMGFFLKAMKITGFSRSDPDTYGWCMIMVALCQHTKQVFTSKKDTSAWESGLEQTISQLHLVERHFSEHFGFPHFGHSQVMHNLGNFISNRYAFRIWAYSKREKDAQAALARQYFQLSMDERIELFGAHHPKVALMHHLLAWSTKSRGEYSKALAQMTQANQALNLFSSETSSDPINPEEIRQISCLPYFIFNLNELTGTHLMLAAESIQRDSQIYHFEKALQYTCWHELADRELTQHRQALYFDGIEPNQRRDRFRQRLQIIQALRLLGMEATPDAIWQTFEGERGFTLKESETHRTLALLKGRLLDCWSRIDSVRLNSITEIRSISGDLQMSFELSEAITCKIDSIQALSVSKSNNNLFTLPDSNQYLFLAEFEAGPTHIDSLSRVCYSFLVTPKGTHFLQDTLPYPIADSILANIKPGAVGSQKAFDNFCRFAHDGYQALFIGRDSLLTNDPLIVLPDKSWGRVPFDLLLRSEPHNTHQSMYRGVDYLGNHLPIIYNSSAELDLRNRSGIGKIDHSISFVPDFGMDSISLPTTRILDLNRKALSPLPGAIREAFMCRSLLNAQLISGPAAREDQFRELAPESGLLHLATHGIAHPANPLESRIVLNQQVPISTSDPNDGFLFAREIYGMNLECELAILSACQTGEGLYAKGEGVLSFAHAFQFAGARSVLTTLWPVPDSTSADIVIEFFRGLKQGSTKSAALARAKRLYLQQADELHSHPYFWAGYVLTGSDRPVMFSKQNTGIPLSIRWAFLLIFVVIIVLAVFFFAPQKKSGKWRL